MAKVRNNIVIQGLSGSLGDQLVVKQDKAGRTIVGVSPTLDPNRTFTEAQLEQQDQFREAAAYAKDAKDQEVYAEKARIRRELLPTWLWQTGSMRPKSLSWM